MAEHYREDCQCGICKVERARRARYAAGKVYAISAKNHMVEAFEALKLAAKHDPNNAIQYQRAGQQLHEIYSHLNIRGLI